jgi:16S rRNA (cytosine967-C5)-methyltransferase
VKTTKPTSVRELALDLIEQVHQQKAYSPLILNQAIETHGLEGRDAALLTQLVYGVLQRELTLEFYLKSFLKPKQKLDTWVRYLLFLSLYQMVFLDRIPSHAIVSEAVNIAKKRGHQGISGFVNGVLRNVLRKGVPSFERLPLEEKLSIEYSHPLWLVERWLKQYGSETTEKILAANNEPPSFTARVNPLKTSRSEILSELENDGFDVTEGEISPDAIVVKKGKLIGHRLFKEGFVSIQDESSMLVARALDVEPGMTVLDTCAGPGGKTTHLAELMKDQGKIVALDLHKHKTALIDNQASRLGIHSIETEALDARKVESVFSPQSFDRLLIDAPCTGFGVIRRKPEIKYTKTEKDIYSLAEIQAAILESCADLLKPGGKLVYSTCTIDHEENRNQIQAFLTNHPDYKLDPTLRERLSFFKELDTKEEEEGVLQILPSDFDTDGFFISCLVREGI